MSTPRIIRLHRTGDPKRGLSPCSFVDPATVEGAPPNEKGHIFFTNATGNLTVGVWEATSYRERIDSYPVDEVMFVLEGSVTIIDAEGKSESFGPGDAFVMPKGFRGTWENRERLRKYFVILE